MSGYFRSRSPTGPTSKIFHPRDCRPLPRQLRGFRETVFPPEGKTEGRMDMCGYYTYTETYKWTLPQCFTCILFHHSLVATSIRSSLLSSSVSSGSCACKNIPSSKSQSNLIVSRPELREREMYRLKSESPEVGGGAISMMM